MVEKIIGTALFCSNDGEKEMKPLHNIKSRQQLRKELAQEDFQRRVCSFYRYHAIEEPYVFRNSLYRKWEPLKVFGRIYVAHEGINAQISVPQPQWDAFVASLDAFEPTKAIFVNTAVTHANDAFLKLDIKVREKIVADGLQEDIFSISERGQHLDPIAFHEKMSQEDVLVVDTRNDYECEIGHFENALTPTSKTFRDVLPELKEKLAENKDKEILMYCTGGIRCEKASAYFKKHGFTQVYQLQGGIINYLHQTKQKGLSSKFHGSNFVFDGRMAEPIDAQKLGRCITCDAPFDKHVDCANQRCHRLMVQCDQCSQQLHACCSQSCADMVQMQ
jgi:UPF0176 protein